VPARELAEILKITRQRVHQIIDGLTTAVASDLEQSIDGIMDGLSRGDYGQFSSRFGARMREFVSKERFAQMRRGIIRALGNYQSREPADVRRQGGTLVLSTRASFQRETASVRVVFEDSLEHLVTGFWIESPQLNSAESLQKGEGK